MMLHHFKKKHFIIMSVSFLSVYLVLLIIGGVGPQYSIVRDANQPMTVCSGSPNNCTLTITPATPVLTWTDSIGALSKSNRNLALYTQINLFDTNSSISSLKIPMRIKLVGVDSERQYDVSTTNQTFPTQCSSRQCQSFLVVNEIGVDYPAYTVTIDLFGFDNITSVEQIDFTFQYVNSSYALFEMLVRLIFVIITVCAFAGFLFSLRKFNWRQWTTEQRFMVLILPALFFFNITSGVGALMIDDFFKTIFISVLFYFWFVIFDGIRKNGTEYSYIKFYVPKIVLAVSFFLSSLVTMSIFEYKQKHDPLSINPSYTMIIFGVISAIIMIVFLFYIVYLIAKGWITTKTLPFINIKLRLLLLLSVFVIAALGLGILFSWIDSTGRNAIQFFSYSGLVNLYIFALTILYLPHPNSDMLYQNLNRDGAELPHLRLDKDKEEEEFNEVYL
ncbi:hypothetical protein PPL_00292 [Heterostelium album PN500]|uniref:Transmembrane protein n=1 Tax=Heterostelium pallidum (strain ATCC 26659 / Pp 5 / PN500) TaxID=670386 RepID=D3AW25_HETP5|nr:hypothetical protein PPL_00292 [Heterostelium album PN500]EFA86498.1 hypothetical protein PPL_00292 [Heterostelium album PN500]|eukprot:XP_020438603.1 hypothetical protein PPL_00292 [Heterostelium album PN500]